MPFNNLCVFAIRVGSEGDDPCACWMSASVFSWVIEVCGDAGRMLEVISLC